MNQGIKTQPTQPTPPPGPVTEGGRRPTGVTGPGGGAKISQEGLPCHYGNASSPTPPNPETTQKPERRRFAKAYKLEVLRQADACSEIGQIGALLRREGLFSSYLVNWRLQRRQGQLGNTPIKKRVAPAPSGDTTRVRQLEHENARLQTRLQQAELILDIQKKVSTILGIPLKTLSNEGSDS